MFGRELGRVCVEFLNDSQRISAVRRAYPVVAEDRDIYTGFVLFLE